jgi:hypothetical protein
MLPSCAALTLCIGKAGRLAAHAIIFECCWSQVSALENATSERKQHEASLKERVSAW